MSRTYAFLGMVLLFMYGAFTATQGLQRQQTDEAVGLVLPLPVDLSLHAGDRFLAANLNYFKTLVFPPEGDSYSLGYRALLHQRVTDLNPQHEDNFFIVTSSLPWEGELATAQSVLTAATESRPWDAMPAFFQGLNELYFNLNVVKAGRLIEHAAAVETGGNKAYFQRLASFLNDKAGDAQIALAYVNLIKKYIHSPLVQVRLKSRIKRLENLVLLQNAAKQFYQLKGHEPQEISDLIELKLLNNIPIDPMGARYIIIEGKPSVLE